MKLRDIIHAVQGTLYFTEEVCLDCDVKGACGADLMSDVLATIQPDAILFTGLCNPQVVRTAQMADIVAIVFVRGKQPARETIDLAEQEGIPLISTPYGMFEVCGRLYKAGLASLEAAV